MNPADTKFLQGAIESVLPHTTTCFAVWCAIAMIGTVAAGFGTLYLVLRPKKDAEFLFCAFPGMLVAICASPFFNAWLSHRFGPPVDTVAAILASDFGVAATTPDTICLTEGPSRMSMIPFGTYAHRVEFSNGAFEPMAVVLTSRQAMEIGRGLNAARYESAIAGSAARKFNSLWLPRELSWPAPMEEPMQSLPR